SAQSDSLPLTAANLCNRASVAMLTSLWCTRVLSIVEIGWLLQRWLLPIAQKRTNTCMGRPGGPRRRTYRRQGYCRESGVFWRLSPGRMHPALPAFMSEDGKTRRATFIICVTAGRSMSLLMHRPEAGKGLA